MSSIKILLARKTRERDGENAYFRSLARAEVRARGGRIPKLTRIKVGRFICAWAAFPGNLSLWMMPFGIAMQSNATPKMYFMDKWRNFREPGRTGRCKEFLVVGDTR